MALGCSSFVSPVGNTVRFTVVMTSEGLTAKEVLVMKADNKQDEACSTFNKDATAKHMCKAAFVLQQLAYHD